ncbi:MAG: hypothetical protein SCH71_07380 [Desulfobulbaceae bacterium]|nr:hypothetical protein [Desulfobulbaceae bacterium]
MLKKIKLFKTILFVMFLAAALQVANCRTVDAREMTAEMVWIGPEKTGNMVFYSYLQEDVWSKPLRLSHENLTNLVPTIASDRSNRTFVVWTVVTGGESFLHFVILRDGKIETGPLKIETGMATNMAPFLAEDYDGAIWLAWSGNNGTTSDVYSSYWENNRWQPAKRVHEKNNVPDILPQLKADPEGTVSVSWNSFGADGYRTMTRKLKNGTTSTASGAAGSDQGKENPTNPLACVKTYPLHAGMLDKAVLLSRCQDEGLPVQVRFVGKTGEKRDNSR